ncbi:MAG: hypothetical protein JOZ41_20510 [Chloroflexi bacterium]|nr:hypothetical protein [Chloroflexota bacterium]
MRGQMNGGRGRAAVPLRPASLYVVNVETGTGWVGTAKAAAHCRAVPPYTVLHEEIGHD